MHMFDKTTKDSFSFFPFVKVQGDIYFFLLVTRVNYFSPLQLHKWQNSTKLSAVWRILLQWRYLSPGPWHQPAFLSVSPCIMAERGNTQCSPWLVFFFLFYEQKWWWNSFFLIQKKKILSFISSGEKLSVFWYRQCQNTSRFFAEKNVFWNIFLSKTTKKEKETLLVKKKNQTSMQKSAVHGG